MATGLVSSVGEESNSGGALPLAMGELVERGA